jgi:hypothetical protein
MNKNEEDILSLIIRLIGRPPLPSLGTLWMCCGDGLGAQNHPCCFVQIN